MERWIELGVYRDEMMTARKRSFPTSRRVFYTKLKSLTVVENEDSHGPREQ